MNIIKNKGFTLAEVLITLAIIGVIAAILFPSILANYTERTFNAKRQALLARMSQAMGELADQFVSYEDATCDQKTGKCTDNASALKFISEGLSKTYKISAICDKDSLDSCDIPSTITRIDGSKFDLKANSNTFITYVPHIMHRNFYSTDVENVQYDTKSAAFTTKNGESVLLFFYPRCKAKETSYENNSVVTIDGAYIWRTSDPYMCVNMIYDLNGGKKKPNRMGEDIGFMTVYYSDSPYVVAPRIIAPNDYTVETYTPTGSTVPVEVVTQNLANYEQAKAACHAMGDNVSLPSFEQASSIAMNHQLYTDLESFKKRAATTNNATAAQLGDLFYWTSTPCGLNNRLVHELDYRTANDESGIYCYDASNLSLQYHYTCVYDN